MLTDANPRGQKSEDGGQIPDTELLRAYAADRSEAAFAELVRRHVGPVYSFALRRVGGDAHLAEDVAQIVFTTLARKGTSLADRPVLGGWLCRATHFAARDVVRAERRRRTRELEAQIMHESTTDNDAVPIDWTRLQPVLDETMGELNDADRDAVWLRFFEGRSFAEVGARLRLNENAARMRVERALDKLHAALARRGVSSTAAALSLALANQASIAAPAGLAATVTGTALADVTSGGAGAWLTFLTMSKIKVGIVSAIVIAVTTTGIVELRANRELRSEVAALQATQASLGELRTENQQLNASLATLDPKNPEADELARLRQRAALLKARPPWVVESKMKSVAAAKNVGWDSDVAALETFVWAHATGEWKTLAANFAWVGDAKPKADAAFAQLSEAVRARYGSPDLLAGTVIFGRGERGYVDYKWTRAGALEAVAPAGNDAVAGYWAGADPDARYPRPGALLRIRSWARLASGQERAVTTDLCYAGGSWTVGTSVFSPDTWKKLVAQIDPATGELLPPKK